MSRSRALQVDATTRLLVVAPHPDDETLGGGVLMQAVRAAGGQVAVVLLTRGEANPWPQRWIEHRWRIDASARQRWGARRVAEMRAAMQRMGLADVEILALAWPDLGVTARLLAPGGEHVARLAGWVAAFQPTLVLAPALSDRHPDHGSSHVLTRLALHHAGSTALLLDYGLHGCAAGMADCRLEHGDPEWAIRKQGAMECYVSQLRLSGGRFRRWARRPERYLPSMQGHGHAPAVVALPWRPGPLARRRGLVLTALDHRGALSWPWDQAPLARSAHGHYDLVRQDRPWAAGPCYLRLAAARCGPWIFDSWGWTRVDTHDKEVRTSISAGRVQ